MTNGTLNGKPDAGNQHVRFDEGEVASCPPAAGRPEDKPRRGSLLYKKQIALVATFTVLSVGFASFGPLENPEDQFRFMWDCGDWALPDLPKRGFNTVENCSPVPWNIPENKPTERTQECLVSFLKRLDICQKHGLGAIQRFRYAWDKKSMEKWPRVRKDGSKDFKHVDASEPAFIVGAREAVAAQARAAANHPALVGALVESEMRGFVEPSFTPRMTAAYRAHSGCSVPEGTNGRNPVRWQDRPDFPKDRVVPDNEPLLDFYRWQWREGDGLANYLDVVSDAFRKNMAHPVFTMFDPSLRNLPQWGCVRGGVDFLNHWEYPYPEPFRVVYDIDQLRAAARGCPGQGVFIMIQCIFKRSQVAPIGEHPANEPAWASEFPETGYCTMPPDLVQEALWHAFSRQVDGIGLWGWNGLYFDKFSYEYEHHKGCVRTNPQTIETVSRVLNEVAVPLGPLFRAVPERTPEVAVLESCASIVLGGNIDYGIHERYWYAMIPAAAANVPVYVLYDDEVKVRGVPETVKVLILPKCDVLTRTSYEAVRKFQRRGGRLVADKDLLPALTADAIFVAAAEEARNMKGDFDDGIVRAAEDADVRNRAVKSAAAKLKSAVGLKLYGDSDDADILVHVRSYKSADYVFAVNDKRTAGSYVGPWRRVLEKGLPNAGSVVVARSAGAVYDLVRHAAVPFSVQGGQTKIPVEYQTNDGKVFLVTPKPLGELSVKMNGSCLTVVSADCDVLIPIAVTGVGAKPFYAVVRDGVWTRTFEDVKGQVAVRNLADGRLVTVSR